VTQAVTLTAGLPIAAGVVFLIAGPARMGWISNFMSKAVIAGFITGMAIQIILGSKEGARKASPSSVQVPMGSLAVEGASDRCCRGHQTLHPARRPLLSRQALPGP
jgi:MFS superfamily sulfate permease-like transporter